MPDDKTPASGAERGRRFRERQRAIAMPTDQQFDRIRPGRALRKADREPGCTPRSISSLTKPFVDPLAAERAAAVLEEEAAVVEAETAGEDRILNMSANRGRPEVSHAHPADPPAMGVPETLRHCSCEWV
jgi:hypothetical protein